MSARGIRDTSKDVRDTDILLSFRILVHLACEAVLPDLLSAEVYLGSLQDIVCLPFGQRTGRLCHEDERRPWSDVVIS